MLVLFLCVSVAGQQSQGTLRGQVTDELGGVVVGAIVTATDAAGVERTATTDDEGRYAFSALPPGRYTIRLTQAGFVPFENTAVEVTAGRTDPLDIVLTVAIEQEEVTVTAEEPIGTDPESNVGAVVLRGADLDALPDDPDDLAEALQALAGPSAGAGGEAQIFLDGFTGGRLPPKESIREIRINQNPFSAEYDRLGYGRVEIFTKPGTDRLRGQAFFNFNDEALNSRPPAAPTRAAFQARRYGGNLSGPIVQKRASFFFDFERRETDDNEIVSAVVLGPGPTFAAQAFSQNVLSPDRRTTFSPRFDYQLNPSNTLVGRYTFERTERLNEGVGGFNLPARSYDVTNTQQTFQLTETSIINQRVINETRFQYDRRRRRQEGGTLSPTVRVNEAFTAGGAQAGNSSSNEDRYELQNYTSWTVGSHSLKAGARLRHNSIEDISQQNFAGTFTFSTLEQYRNTLLDAAGARPTQFSISGGNPEAGVSQTDFSPFIQDDWRVRPNLTVSAGLRYEVQTNIDSSLDFAPRLAFAWAPGSPGGGGGGGRGQQRTVIRGGFGVFFERFGENFTLQAERQNGVNQRQFIVTGATQQGIDLLESIVFTPGGTVVNPPTVESLSAFERSQAVRRVAADLRTPYTMQTSLSVERQLPYRITVSLSYIGARTLHVLRSRNLNAPLLGANGLPMRDASNNLVRPSPALGNIFQYESSGRFNQHQFVVNVNNRFSQKFTVFSNYVYNRARSDTDGAFSFPSNPYDLSGEYGRSTQDTRHRFFLGGAINALPWGVRLNPFLVANSGRPFNIIVGRDINLDTQFTERPAFADSQTPACPAGANPLNCDLRETRFGRFDVNPKPGQTIIPRNFGQGPSFFTVNLRASKTIGFGEVVNAAAGRQGRGGGGGGRGGGGRGGGGRGGGGRGGGRGGGGGGESLGGGERTEHRYNMTFSVNVQNLLNHPNEGTP
ncbi:MAG TPA: carboxypeptidase regulatory-like domain-containing protein, partial [Pyrinomonadaceae bacterium]|nr:carboxypeptidase regulatory-like domain-containing protein [Pyrinomonadaceae bacterium]